MPRNYNVAQRRRDPRAYTQAEVDAKVDRLLDQYVDGHITLEQFRRAKALALQLLIPVPEEPDRPTFKREPEMVCWACGGPPPHQWCHITPAELGGSMWPVNLARLCHVCHDLSPNTIDRAAFIRWVDNWPGWRGYAERVLAGQEDSLKAHWEALVGPFDPFDARVREFRQERDTAASWGMSADFAGMHWCQTELGELDYFYQVSTDLVTWLEWCRQGKPKEQTPPPVQAPKPQVKIDWLDEWVAAGCPKPGTPPNPAP